MLLIEWEPTISPDQTVLITHIAFNLALLGFLPFVAALEAPLRLILQDAPQLSDPRSPQHRSVLDESVIDKPQLALACVRREVLRMANIVEDMIAPVMEIYAN